MAQFQSEIELRVKVVDKEIKELEKRIEKLGKKPAAVAEKAGLEKTLRLRRGENQLIKSRIALGERVRAGNIKELNDAAKLTRLFKDAAKVRASYAKSAERAAAATAKEAAASKRIRQKRLDTLALGAGFPLLFGGGAGAVGGGVLGGLLGTMGGGSGFGAQILGSALGTAVDTFAQDAAKTGQALNSTGGAFDLLTEKSLFSSKETERLANELAELGRVEELAELATRELVGIIGNKGVESLQTLGDTTDETTRLWSQLTLQLQALISGPLNGFLSLVNQFLGSVVNPQRFRNLVEENQEAQDYFNSIVEQRNRRGRVTREGLSKAEARAATLEKFPPVVTAEIPVTPEDRTRFAPPKAKPPGTDKAAREEERLQKRLAQLRAETALIKDQTALIQEQTTAKIEGNKLTQIDVEALVKSVELDARRLRTLIGVTDERERAAINAKFEAEQTKLTTQAVADQEVVRAALNKQIDESVIGFENQVALIGETNEKARELLKIEQDIAKLKRDNPFITDEQLNKYRLAAQGAAGARAQQKKYNETLKQVQGIVTPAVNSLVGGLREVVAGTKTAEEAFADFLTTIADQLINTAATMIAQYIAIGIARMFAFGNNSPGLDASGGGTPLGSLSGSMPFSFAPPGLATGGTANGGQPYIVGEKGPELFIPGVTGTVSNNDQFEAARNAMSSNPELAFDENTEALGASSSSISRNNSSDVTRSFAENNSSIAMTNSYMRERAMEINNQTTIGGAGSMVIETQVINSTEYATVEQVRLASAASAKQARAQVFSDMKNKPSRRAMVGLK